MCGSAFAFELRLLGLAVGPCVRPCGGPLHDDNFDLAGLPAHRLILFGLSLLWRQLDGDRPASDE